MQNSRSQPSASDSAMDDALNADSSAEDVSPTNDIGEQGEPHNTVVSSEETIVDPVVEPEFLNGIHPAAQVQTASKPGYMPSPEESTVKEPAHRSRSLRLQWRFWHTIIFAAWIFFRAIFWQIYVHKYFPNWVERTNVQRWRIYARQYSRFAIRMGGVFIKLGQFISTRVDIFPEEIIKELEKLQDEVPTIKFDKIRKVMQQELGPIRDRFEYFDETPIAAASLGQVHRGRLLNGDKVVVKVQRPGIRETGYTDLAAMRVVARFAMRFPFISRRCDAVALVDEFGRVFLQELSYKHEAYNAERFAAMFKDDMGVYIPSVYHEHSTDQVMTLEDVTTIKINDYAALERAGVNRKAVATRLMDTYLKQTFDHYFFHADPHPGNLFVYPLPVDDESAEFGEEGRPFYLIFVDFGMTGALTKEIADGLVSTLHAVLTRNPRQLIDSYVKLGFILPGADLERIEGAAKATFDQVWGLSMTEMRDMPYDKVTDLADEFSDLLLAMPFYIPQDFIYLGRTISIMSGMTTSLDPTFNPWHGLQPYTEALIARGFGIDVPKGKLLSEGLNLSTIQSLFNGNSTEVLRTIGQEVIRRTMPPQLNQAEQTMRQLQEGDIHIVAELSAAHRQQLKRIERETRKTGRSVFIGSILVSSTLLYTNGDVQLAIAGFVLCGLTVLYGVLRD